MTFTKKQKLDIANSLKDFFPETFKNAFINMFGDITVRMNNLEDLLNAIEMLKEWGFECEENMRLNSFVCCKEKHIGYKFTF